MNKHIQYIFLLIILPRSIGCHLGEGRQDEDLEVSARHCASCQGYILCDKAYGPQILAKEKHFM